jgi:LacI family transcriptional regulator
MQAYAKRSGDVYMPLTTKDLAKMIGVSQSTVSRCLNDSNLVSSKTKEMVKRIAKEQGFLFNANAKSLSTSKTNTIGIIYPENFYEFENMYMNSLHNQIRNSIENLNMDYIITFVTNKCTGESNIKNLVLRRKVDGLIIVKHELDQEILLFLKKSKIPFIFMHLFLDNYELLDTEIVSTDHFKGGYIATEHLIQLGHKRILCVSDKNQDSEFIARIEGYQAALKDNNIPFDENLVLYASSFKEASCLVYANEALIRSVSAVFVHKDIYAWGIIQALKEINIKIPQDIAVVGYDDIELSENLKPYLTTVHQPREEIARITCARLVELINSKKIRETKKIFLQPKLIIRDSSIVKA